MTPETVNQAIAKEWDALRRLGFSEDQVQIDRFGENLPPNAPLSRMIICRVSLAGVKAESRHFGLYEANLLMALRLVRVQLETIAEVGKR